MIYPLFFSCGRNNLPYMTEKHLAEVHQDREAGEWFQDDYAFQCRRMFKLKDTKVCVFLVCIAFWQTAPAMCVEVSRAELLWTSRPKAAGGTG